MHRYVVMLRNVWHSVKLIIPLGKGTVNIFHFYTFNLSQCIKVDNELLADTKLIEWEMCNNIDQ